MEKGEPSRELATEQRDVQSQERREFIEKCGRFALVTPPTISIMLVAEARTYQAAASGGNLSRQQEQQRRIQEAREEQERRREEQQRRIQEARRRR